MTYKALTAYSTDDLEKQILQYKAAGWREQGGLTISYPVAVHIGTNGLGRAEVQGNLLMYGQAMYFPEPLEK